MLGGVKTSVLMTVYAGDDPAHFRDALDSMLAQRSPADQLVLVADGEISEPQQQIVDAALARSNRVQVLQLPKNIGLTGALNAGLQQCEGDLVFRMDADDFSLPERIETQLAFMQAHPEIGVLGSAMEEFQHDPAAPERIKSMPVTHDEIVRALAFRNPVNHPTVCFRRELVAAEGYPDLPLVEDYLLWAKLIARGVRFHNLETPLLRYRFNDGTVGRRSGWRNFKSEMKLRWWMYQQELISLPGVIGIGIVQFVVRFSPSIVQRILWKLTRSEVP